jgi:hypothetical protein
VHPDQDAIRCTLPVSIRKTSWCTQGESCLIIAIVPPSTLLALLKYGFLRHTVTTGKVDCESVAGQ